MITKEKMRKEAIKRMKLFGICSKAIMALEQHNQVYISMENGVFPIKNDELNKEIKKFEQKYNTYVYHCIYTECEFGILYNLLYVSKYADEWQFELTDIQNGFPTARVINVTDPNLSESGAITVMPLYGGLRRVY